MAEVKLTLSAETLRHVARRGIVIDSVMGSCRHCDEFLLKAREALEGSNQRASEEPKRS